MSEAPRIGWIVKVLKEKKSKLLLYKKRKNEKKNILRNARINMKDTKKTRNWPSNMKERTDHQIEERIESRKKIQSCYYSNKKMKK